MKTKFTSQRKGAVLMTVTVVSVMMMVIIAAATSLVNHTNVRTNKEYRKKQAYYVASSCLRAFVSQTTGVISNGIDNDAEIAAKLKQIREIAREGKEIPVKIEKLENGVPTNQTIGEINPRWSNASCKLKLEWISDDSVKAISTATYLGQEKIVVAYLSAQTLHKHEFTPKALEIIGTDGGNSKGYFENIRVYGSTGATDPKSHDDNTLYGFHHNKDELYGDVDINGSMVAQNATVFKSNPYYYQGTDDSKGCVLNVSRSFIIANNCPVFAPDFEKKATDNNDPRVSPYNYNYVNVGEALVYTANSGGYFGSEDKQVDVYAKMLYIGTVGSMKPEMKNAIAHSSDEEFWKKAYQFSSGNGCGFKVYGNVYTLPSSDIKNPAEFHGDVVVNTEMVINGELYVGGDLYINNLMGNGFNCKKIHMLPGNYIFLNQDRDVDASGKPTRSGNGTQPSTITSNGKEIPVTYDDWTGEARSHTPDFPLLQETPYYYFPEHLLCERGTNGTVSTIVDQYTAMYDAADKKTIVAPNATSFGTDGNVYTIDGGTGSFKPDHIVTDDCYIDYLDNKKILIDLDQLPTGKKNLVVILKNEGKTANENVILVKNSTDPESDEAKFCYFVSDSGVGTTYDEYGDSGHDKNTISTYDHSSFNKNPKFTFGGSRNVVMDFNTFCNVDCSGCNGATSGDQYANPTQNPANNGFEMKSNNIIFLFTEGSELEVKEAETLIQASVYMPRATYTNTNKGGQCKVAPYYKDSRLQALNIIGNIVCNRYDTNSGNNNTIVYNRLSSKSMLAYVKGAGEEKASKSFMLDYYDNH